MLGDNSPQITHGSPYLASRNIEYLCSGVSFQGHLYIEQPRKVEIVSSSLAKGRLFNVQDNKDHDSLLGTRQASSRPLSFLNQGFPSCDTIAPVQESPGLVCITVWELSQGTTANTDYYYPWVRKSLTSDLKVSYLLPAAMANLLACKTLHSSWQLHIFKVHLHKIHINQKEETRRCCLNRVITVKITHNGKYWHHVPPDMAYWKEYISLWYLQAWENKRPNWGPFYKITVSILQNVNVRKQHKDWKTFQIIENTRHKMNSLCF